MPCSCNDPVAILPTPAQPLYPFVVSPEGAPGCIFTIPSGTAFLFPFWLCPGKAITVNAVLTSRHNQDNSLSLWVSKAPLGQPVLTSPISFTTWKAARVLTRTITYYDAASPHPDWAALALPVTDGPYLLHVLNLTNSLNEFSLRIDESGVDARP